MLMQFPCLVQIFVCFRFQHLRSSGKLFLGNGGMTDSLDLTDLANFPAVGKGKGSALSAGTAGSADTVHIIFDVLRNVVIDNRLHIVHVNPSGCHIRSDQNAGSAVTETVHGHITLCLGQIAMQPFCLKALLLQQIRQFVHLFLRITEDQGQLRLIVL